MEFEGVFCFALGDMFVGKQDSEGFEDGYGAGAVIVCAGSGEQRGKEEVDAVLVSANDNRLFALSGKGSNDTVLTPGVLERTDDACAGFGEGVVYLA